MITSRVYRRIALRRGNIDKIYYNYQSSQYLRKGQININQRKSLIKLITHANDNVPYYTKLFRKIGFHPSSITTLNDLEKIPVLTKDTIKENFDLLIARNVDRDTLVANATGGSTGTPLQLLQDQNFRIHAEAARIRGWMFVDGYQLGDTYALLWGADRDIQSNFSIRERLSTYLKYGEIPMNAFNLSEERKIEFIRWCRILRPKILRAYVSSAKDLAEFLEDRGIFFPSLVGVVLGAETVDPNTRAYIEKVFRTKVYSSYGCRELGLLAMECSEGKLHLISENHYFEFLPLTGRVAEGMSEIVITNLRNYAMPLIRYQIGDIAVKGEDIECECGRGLPTIKRVVGRTTEVFHFPDGTAIAGEMFIHLMKDFPVSMYQFVQTGPAKVVLQIQTINNLKSVVKKAILAKYKQYLPETVSIEIVEKEEIPKTETGKFRFVRVDFRDA